MASLTRDDPLIQAAKALTLTSTLFAFSTTTQTTLTTLPSLLLATAQPSAKSKSRPSASRRETGRLTPQPQLNETHGQLTPGAALKGLEEHSLVADKEGYKLAAQQFLLHVRANFATTVPAEIIAIASSSYLAYRTYNLPFPLSSTKTWAKYAVIAGLVASVFPLSGVFMAPLEKKLARTAGEEEGVEPYEDSPPDWEMERGNCEEFLKGWGGWNVVRGGLLGVAAGVGVWGVVV